MQVSLLARVLLEFERFSDVLGGRFELLSSGQDEGQVQVGLRDVRVETDGALEDAVGCVVFSQTRQRHAGGVAGRSMVGAQFESPEQRFDCFVSAWNRGQGRPEHEVSFGVEGAALDKALENWDRLVDRTFLD